MVAEQGRHVILMGLERARRMSASPSSVASAYPGPIEPSSRVMSTDTVDQSPLSA